MRKIFTTKVKKIVLLIALYTLSVAIAYGTATFYPNKFVIDRMNKDNENKMIAEWNKFGFQEPAMEYSNSKQFIEAVARCVDFINLGIEVEKRVPRDIIIAMAVLETGYGNSRFAHEANNLFGIRTWSPTTPQLKPKENPGAEWGVKKYKTKCASVKDMVDIVNRHSAYEGFRIEREQQVKSGKVDIHKLIDQLSKWSTNPEYVDLVKNRADKIHEDLKNAK